MPKSGTGEPFKTTLRSVIDRVKRLQAQSAGPVLIAIDGRSGAGKSTLAQALRAHLDCTLVVGDDFYAGGCDLHPHAPAELAYMCIDRQRLRGVLAMLKAGREASYAAFDWSAFDGRLSSELTRLEPRPVILVEGVYSNHPDLRDLVDLAILVTVPDEERARRLIQREGELTEWERQWHRAEDWYFEKLAGADQFDIALQNA